MRSISSRRAVSIMIGTLERSRSQRVRERPSTSGIIRSRITKSGICLSKIFIACLPFDAICTLNPARLRYRLTTSAILASSSTTRIVFVSICVPMILESITLIDEKVINKTLCHQRFSSYFCNYYETHLWKNLPPSHVEHRERALENLCDSASPWFALLVQLQLLVFPRRF